MGQGQGKSMDVSPWKPPNSWTTDDVVDLLMKQVPDVQENVRCGGVPESLANPSKDYKKLLAECGKDFAQVVACLKGFTKPDDCRKFIEQRVRKQQLTGKDLAQMCSSSPGVVLEKDKRFVAMFEDDDKESAEACRHAMDWKIFGRGDKIATLFKHLWSHMTTGSVEVEQAKGKMFEIIPQEFFNPEFDAYFDGSTESPWLIKCGVPKWMPSEGIQVLHGWYTKPTGWFRLALRVNLKDRGFSEEEAAAVFTHWHKAYHGTSADNLKSFIELGPRKPGEHGVKMKAGATGAGAGGAVYASPCIEYSAHPLYTLAKDGTEQMVKDNGCSLVIGENSYAQYVFELRVRPDGYRLQGNTLWSCAAVKNKYGKEGGWPGGGQGKGIKGKPMAYSKFCMNESLEMIIDDANDVVVTGVMVRYLPESPHAFIKRYCESQRAQTEWNTTDEDNTGEHRRPREHGVSDESLTKPVWEYNCNKGRGQGGRGMTTSPSDANDWQQFEDNVSDLIELAYQQYQRFCYLGEIQIHYKDGPPSDPEPRYVDFFELSCDGEGGREAPTKHYHSHASGAMMRVASIDQNQNNRIRAVRRRVKKA